MNTLNQQVNSYLNIIIDNEYLISNHDLIKSIFGNETYIIYNTTLDFYDALVELGSFKSKGDAKKNWIKTGKEFELGYNEYLNIGKLKRGLYIWNPIK